MSSRFRDDPSSSNNTSWQRSNHHSHTRRKGKGNPIGNWINRRRRNRPTNESGTRAVGTEALAIQNISNNSKHFNYPKEGFITPIEHSLLYAMILYPEQYPESVVRKEIEDEEFEQYLFVKDDGRFNQSAPANNSTDGAGDGEDDADEDTTNYEERASYAQLSALLALSAAKNPATPSGDKQQPRPEQEPQARNSLTMQATSNITRSKPINEDQLSIGQILCRKILKTVTKYSEAHNLDRQQEISELLSPVEKRCQIRNEQAALKQLLPAYAGYTLSLVTGNPLPLFLGAASLAGQDPMMEENSNVSDMRGMGGRMGDMETAGLLDECDDD